MGACPVRVISFENYSIDSVNQQLKAVDVPDEFSEKPRILVLACENDAYPALDMAGQAAHSGSGVTMTPFARVIPVRCLGSVSLSWITDSLNSGYDGVVLMGCRRDDDYQCHFVRGSALAAERLSKVGDTLTQLNLEPERVVVYEVAITDVQRAPAVGQRHGRHGGEDRHEPVQVLSPCGAGPRAGRDNKAGRPPAPQPNSGEPLWAI